LAIARRTAIHLTGEIRRDTEFDGRDARATGQVWLSRCRISELNSTIVFADGLGT